MTIPQTGEPSPRKPLRLWPGVALAALVLLTRFIAPLVSPEAAFVAVIGGVLGSLGIALWWLFLSRATWAERLAAVVLAIVSVALTPRILHPSIATGMMGFMFYLYVIPVLGLTFVVWAVATRRLPDGLRRALMVATIVLTCGAFALLRTNGITGDADSDLAWRWSPTPEERLLASEGNEPEVLLAAPPPEAPKDGAGVAASDEPARVSTPTETVGVDKPPEPRPEPKEPASAVGRADNREGPPAVAEDRSPIQVASVDGAAEWPGFRGPGRDGVVRGTKIGTDWAAAPPVELWRQPVGPGWSSFAVRGDLLYTQEQRGEDEVVSCYKVSTGEPVWRHRDATRFWESNAGAGPRATPTLSEGRLFTLGATGIVNALNAIDGSVEWSRNAASDTGVQVPGWGFAGSPLVFQDLVVVATAGRLVAYDAATGDPRWMGPKGGWGYSSPHLAKLGGVAQVLLLNGAGVISLSPTDGELLWEHGWRSDGIVQPSLTEEGDLLIGSGSGLAGAASGTLRIAVSRQGGGWNVQERWTSIALKPYFNDFVVHRGHAYGFDGSLLACLDLADGKRIWKGGRYGHGQLVLLPDQDLLLVLSEQGELALVGATPDGFTELARVPALEGKTWNHPVLVDDILLVRNDREMAAFRLSPPR